MYLEGTEHRTAAFNKLTQGDADAARVIEQRMKQLHKLQVCVSTLDAPGFQPGWLAAGTCVRVWWEQCVWWLGGPGGCWGCVCSLRPR